MSELFMMNVRADESPHEILGQLPVPLAAVQGQMQVVGFQPRVSSKDMRSATTTGVFLTACPFGLTGSFPQREYALRVKRAEWPALKESLS